MPKKTAQLENQIQRIQRELMELGPMRPGSLSKQYRDPESKKRPFYQISYTHRGRGRSEYARPENLVELRREMKNFKRFRMLTEQWVELSLEASQLRVKNANTQA
jgi:hypothetical protein